MENETRYTEANRKAWNMAMPYHRKAKDREWDLKMADPSFIFQKEPELSKLKDIGVVGKDIVQLCCNNGLELLSLKRLGANRCVGFDICDEAISDGQRRSSLFNIPVEFNRENVYDIPHIYDDCFDLVYVTIGALTWLPDIATFFEIAFRLLRDGGKLFIYESHPFSMMLPWDVSLETHSPELVESYFHDTYSSYKEGLDYYGNESYDAPEAYEFMYTLSDILNAIIANGLSITGFWEYEHDISNGLKWVENSKLRLPLSYILIAGKA